MQTILIRIIKKEGKLMRHLNIDCPYSAAVPPLFACFGYGSMR